MCHCLQVNAINVMFVLVLLVGVPVPPLRWLMSHLLQVWSCIVILVKMIYQLRLVQEEQLLQNCTAVEHLQLQENESLPEPWDDVINNAEWFGLRKTNHLANYLKVSGSSGCQCYLIIPVLLSVVSAA